MLGAYVKYVKKIIASYAYCMDLVSPMLCTLTLNEMNKFQQYQSEDLRHGFFIIKFDVAILEDSDTEHNVRVRLTKNIVPTF